MLSHHILIQDLTLTAHLVIAPASSPAPGFRLPGCLLSYDLTHLPAPLPRLQALSHTVAAPAFSFLFVESELGTCVISPLLASSTFRENGTGAMMLPMG